MCILFLICVFSVLLQFFGAHVLKQNAGSWSGCSQSFDGTVASNLAAPPPSPPKQHLPQRIRYDVTRKRTTTVAWKERASVRVRELGRDQQERFILDFRQDIPGGNERRRKARRCDVSSAA